MTENTKKVVDYIEANYIGYEEDYDYLYDLQFNKLLNQKVKKEIGTTIVYSTLKRYFEIEKRRVEFTWINDDEEEEKGVYLVYKIKRRK